MATTPYRILILDDDPNISSLLTDFLTTTLPCSIQSVSSIGAFWATLKENRFDLLFLDLRLPDGNGMDVLQELQTYTPYLPTVVMSGAGNEKIAVQAIRFGALDYLAKGSFQLDILPALVEKAVQAKEIRVQAQRYFQQVNYQAMLLDHMRDAIVVWNENDKITYWNQAAEYLYGRRASEMVGQSVGDAYLNRFIPRVKPASADRSRPTEAERLYLQIGQSPRWISSKLTALFDPNNPKALIGFMDVTRDITTRKKEQEELNHHQLMIQRVVDVSPNIIYIIDLEEKSLSYCNPQLTKILGHPLDEVKAGSLRFLAKMLHTADKKTYIEHLQSFRTQTDDTVKEIEVRVRSKNGQYRWLSCRETVFTNSPTGLVKEIIGVALDVTDRKRFEENLRQRLEAEKLLSTISTYFINLAPAKTDHGIEEALELVRQFVAADACTVMRLEDQILSVGYSTGAEKQVAGDDQTEKTLGETTTAWLSSVFETQDYLWITPAEIPLEHRHAMEFFFKSPGCRQAVLIPMVCNYDLIGVMVISGTWNEPDWKSTHLSLLRTFSEIIVNGLVQKQSEEALIASENRYRAIVDEHQTMMICRFCPDFTLTYANLTYCQYYQQNSDQVLGTSFLANVHPDDQDVFLEAITAIGEGSPIQTLSHRCPEVSRQVYHLEWTIRAIHDHQGEIIEYQAVGRDISERKQMEEQVQSAQTQLMQSARLASVGQLAASVAHQISNPLTTIIADAQLLIHALDRAHPGRESAEAIIQAGWRAQRVIQLLTKFSQPDDHSFQPVLINDTIEKAILLTGVHLQAGGINLNLALSSDVPEMIGNERQLIDLWVNLILMAFSGRTEKQKATTIWIRTSLSEPDQICIEICDDGFPIATDQSESIFEPRLIPTGTNLWTGIELSICREIVRQHNGKITARSDAETTVFSILLPRGPHHEPSQHSGD